MRRIKLFCVAFCAAFAVFAIVSNDARMIERARGYSTGPPAGFTGAPDETTCAACHSGPSTTGQFSITAPSSYVPGQTYL
ncbi:MAG: hypothetical protein KBD94_02935, partial [Pyrinomonadaceae bacterium]|nr:hypothetical protein [Pyrinomonadaceae bacterium]